MKRLRRVDELAAQGHGPQKHEGRVNRAQHEVRVLRGVDPETGDVAVWKKGKKKQWIREGRSAKWREREAFKLRKEARLRARAKMGPEGIKWAEARDTKKYGHPDGPTFEQGVAKARAKGLAGDPVYEEIVDAAQRSDPDVNRGLLGGN